MDSIWSPLKEREDLLLSENIVKRWSVEVEIAEGDKEVNWSSVCWSEYLLAPSQKEKLYFNTIMFTPRRKIAKVWQGDWQIRDSPRSGIVSLQPHLGKDVKEWV